MSLCVLNLKHFTGRFAPAQGCLCSGRSGHCDMSLPALSQKRAARTSNDINRQTNLLEHNIEPTLPSQHKHQLFSNQTPFHAHA